MMITIDLIIGTLQTVDLKSWKSKTLSFCSISNLINKLRLHQFLGTKTIRKQVPKKWCKQSLLIRLLMSWKTRLNPSILLQKGFGHYISLSRKVVHSWLWSSIKVKIRTIFQKNCAYFSKEIMIFLSQNWLHLLDHI